MDAKSISRKLADLSEAIGANILFKSTTGATGIVGLPPYQHMHDGAYCQRVKADPQRHRACQECYTQKSIWEGNRIATEGGAFQCHAGVHQVAVPVLFGKKYAGVLLAGDFRDPKTAPRFVEGALSKAYRKLPVMEGRRVEALVGTLQVLAIYLETLHSNMSLSPQSVQHPGLSRALAWMNQAPPGDLSVRKAAEVAGLSPSRFVHLFGHATGGSFSSFRIKSRIEKSKKLLSESDRSMAEISEAVGYARQSQFAYVFRQHTGMSPSAYRIRARQTLP